MLKQNLKKIVYSDTLILNRGKDFMKIKMSLQRDFEKYLSGSIFLTLLLLIIISCKKEDLPVNDDEPLIRKEDSLKTYSPTVKFEVTGRLLEGKRIDCIEPNYKGNTWIASGQELFHYKNGTLENSYTLTFQSVISQLQAMNRYGLQQVGVDWVTLQKMELAGLR